MIRSYINATIGFSALSRTVTTRPESLMRMFGPKGNPSAANLFGVIAALQNNEGIHFTLKPTDAKLVSATSSPRKQRAPSPSVK
jgi:DNA-binding phage protein